MGNASTTDTRAGGDYAGRPKCCFCRENMNKKADSQFIRGEGCQYKEEISVQERFGEKVCSFDYDFHRERRRQEDTSLRCKEKKTCQEKWENRWPAATRRRHNRTFVQARCHGKSTRKPEKYVKHKWPQDKKRTAFTCQALCKSSIHEKRARTPSSPPHTSS